MREVSGKGVGGRTCCHLVLYKHSSRFPVTFYSQSLGLLFIAAAH